MGTKKRNPPSRAYSPPEPRRSRWSVAEALFSSTQRRVLGLLFGQPRRSFFANEVIHRVGAGSGAVQRELKKLEQSGLVDVSWVGNQKHYQANSDSPIFKELSGLIRKTVGLVSPLRDALEPKRRAIELAFVYGSVARGEETATSDVDLLLVSNSLDLEEVYRLLEPAEQALDRKVNPTLYTTAGFSRRRRARHPFLKKILAGQTIVLIGTIPDEPHGPR